MSIRLGLGGRRTWRALVPNLVLLCVAGWVLWQRVPGVVQNVRTEGTRLPPVTLTTLRDVEVRIPDATIGRVVLIFWATWCGPCKVELSRFADGVIGGDIDGARVFAVDMGEERAVVEAHVAERRYPFTVGFEPTGALLEALNPPATPTIVYLQGDGRVEAVHSGLQPFSVSRAARFLEEK